MLSVNWINLSQTFLIALGTAMRRSTAFITATSLGACFLSGLILLHPLIIKKETRQRLVHMQMLADHLALTDICLFTEASYLRHPNLADRFAPFQDGPSVLSHFPSESLLSPPLQVIHVIHPTSRESLP